MKQLYAYDFDKTLIPYDSFNRFLKELLHMNIIRVGWILLKRVLRVSSATIMKQQINDLVLSNEKYLLFAKAFAERVANDVRWVRPQQGITLILSASPMCYMQFLEKILDCKVVASNWRDGQFVNMYGEEKLQYLQTDYPHTQYEWYYAASDSESDLCWMTKFKNFEIITR